MSDIHLEMFKLLLFKSILTTSGIIRAARKWIRANLRLVVELGVQSGIVMIEDVSDLDPMVRSVLLFGWDQQLRRVSRHWQYYV